MASNDFTSFWGVVQLHYCKALVFWRSDVFDETLPMQLQLHSAYQVTPLTRSEALTMAQALFTEHKGLPEEVYLNKTTHVPHEEAPDHPEMFQRFLQLRAAQKEHDKWSGPKLPKFQKEHLAELDRYIALIGSRQLP